MSYIRCLSNPEGLYIWDGQGRVMIAGVHNAPLLSMPTSVFDEVMRRYDDWSTHIRYKGATFRPSRAKEHKFGKMILHYKDWPKGQHVEAWEVTWTYIAQHVKKKDILRKKHLSGNISKTKET
jgi:hypothetical protein